MTDANSNVIYSASALPTRSGDHRYIGNVLPGVAPLLLDQIIGQGEHFVVVIAKDGQQAHAIEQGLRFFSESKAKPAIPLLFPDWETLPYDTFSPHEDIVSQRLETLSQLPRQTSGVLIVTVNTLLQKLAPQQFIHSNSLSLKVGQRFDPLSYRQDLEQVGYRCVDTVYQHGEFAIRGSIFDLYPMGSEQPVRIELFDDEIDSLREFDPETQRSHQPCRALTILPANEFPWDASCRLNFRNQWLAEFPNAASSIPLLRDIKDGIKPHGVEYYSPLFFEEMASLFDYLPANSLFITPPSMDESISHFWEELNKRYEDRRHDIQRPILKPEALYLRSEECFSNLGGCARLTLDADTRESKTGRSNLHCSVLGSVAVDDRSEKPLSALQQYISELSLPTLIVAESAGRREVISDLIRSAGFSFSSLDSWQAFVDERPSLALTVGGLDQGFILDDQLAVITEFELFGQRVQQTRRRRKTIDNSDQMVRNLTELRIGAPVVHIDHGVGRYRGLETITVDGNVDEFLMLEYADQAKLYVPVSSLNLISRYSGTDEALAPLHKLGTEKWSVAKQKAMEKIRDTAAELLEVYARREARKGFAFDSPGDAYRKFCASFPFEETPDQQTVINAVMSDMSRERPMDRLVCGDVGFGKTEIAMRAAFMATYSGKQVAVLVPTTLLAQQHYESFQDRFADTAVRVEVLSRFNSAKEQSKAMAAIAEGKADIVIGTHKLIQQDLKFKDLGLLIIDEEHRFGVQQKEKLKAFRANVDILTLTATPIPRTLNMAMGGIRDLSIIATPPAKRLSVKTFVREREDALIRESVLREILRGGQVYYLFNDVQKMEKEVEHLQQLVPEGRVGFAHGQMRERELEQAMSDFYHQRFNILVCSTIIETGIDVPNANTIIIDRADKFGLAQLHQLRGRVGRSHHQAYAYLLTPPSKKLTRDAEKRLEAITASQDLGAGFMLATHDLEIRGAGELLGEEQSGQIQSIGFNLYMELLEQAVQSLKLGKELSLEQTHHGAEINLRIPAIIPEDYLPDVHERLILYKRIANAKDSAALKDIQVEMIDRFGLLSEPVKNLLRQTELKIKAEALGILKVDLGATSGKVEFAADTEIDPLTIVQLVQKDPMRYRLDGATRLKFEVSAEKVEEKFTAIEDLLDKLSKRTSPPH